MHIRTIKTEHQLAHVAVRCTSIARAEFSNTERSKSPACANSAYLWKIYSDPGWLGEYALTRPVLLPEGVGSSRLHSSLRLVQLLQGACSSHFTLRCLHRLQPFRDFFVPSWVIPNRRLALSSSVDMNRIEVVSHFLRRLPSSTSLMPLHRVN